MRWQAGISGSSVNSESAVPKLTVEAIDNHIYFYSGVDSDRCLALIRSIRELDSKLRNEHATRGLPETHPLTPIWLHMESHGGALFSAFGVADQIQKIKTPIYSVVEGFCASAGTVISVSCSKRYITPNAFMLIHQLSNMAWGKYEEIKDEMKLMDMAMKNLIAVYTTKTKMSEEQVREYLKRDTWFNAKECVRYGLVDAIL